jgi:WD40 repeat protein
VKPLVRVLSSADLKPLYTPDLASPAATYRSLPSVAWSATGNLLVAGGSATGSGVIRLWADGGRGRGRDIGEVGNTVLELLPLRNGSFLFCSAVPEFGVVSGTGEIRILQGPGQLDFSTVDTSRLLLSEDAATVEHLSLHPQRRVRFALRQRRVDLDAELSPGLTSAVIDFPGLAITDWRNTFSPALNGRVLRMRQGDQANSLAIAPDGRSFVLGTQQTVSKFSADGQQIWSVAAEGSVFAINVARSGVVIVSAEGDGTFRWRRLSDGVELLAVFISRDGRRWVAWTPQGYYDASAGGDELIGWQVNNGADHAPDFFAVG